MASQFSEALGGSKLLPSKEMFLDCAWDLESVSFQIKPSIFELHAKLEYSCSVTFVKPWSLFEL